MSEPAKTPTVSDPKKSKVRRRRMIRRIVKYALFLIILLALAGAGLWYYRQQQDKATLAGAVSYQQAVVTSGSLDKYVYGTGSIQAASQPTVLAQTDGKLIELRVSVGDDVKQGQILAVLSNDDLDDEIQQLEYSLWDMDNTITTTSAGSDVTSIKSPSAGRVMKIYAQPGDDALAIYRRLGSVAILSTDGRMKVEFEVADGISLAYGDPVVVSGEGFTQEGTVTDVYMQGTRAIVTVVNDALPMDAAVSIRTQSGEPAGEGTLVINKPMAVSAFGGTIKAVRVKEGAKVERKQELFTLEDSPITLKVENLRLQRETAAASLQQAREKRENLIVRAPEDGVVATVTPAVGDDITSGSAICSILVGEDMLLTVAVDELDVVSVQPGQAVNISVDALPDLTIAGLVEKIAPVGTSESGVAKYDVQLSFAAAGTGVRPGMNASGQVQVAHVDNALYIPVEALMTMAGGKYVLVDGSGASALGPLGAGQGTFPQNADMQAFAQSGDAAAMRQQYANQSADQTSDQTSRRGIGADNLPSGGTASQLPSSSTTTATQQTGSLRQVTVGLMNDDYAQVLSGLSAGEVVLYQQSSSSSSSSNSTMMRTTNSIPGMMF